MRKYLAEVAENLEIPRLSGGSINTPLVVDGDGRDKTSMPQHGDPRRFAMDNTQQSANEAPMRAPVSERTISDAYTAANDFLNAPNVFQFDWDALNSELQRCAQFDFSNPDTNYGQLSTGIGLMMGTGTNAPLSTQAFLRPSNPLNDESTAAAFETIPSEQDGQGAQAVHEALDTSHFFTGTQPLLPDYSLNGPELSQSNQYPPTAPRPHCFVQSSTGVQDAAFAVNRQGPSQQIQQSATPQRSAATKSLTEDGPKKKQRKLLPRGDPFVMEIDLRCKSCLFPLVDMVIFPCGHSTVCRRCANLPLDPTTPLRGAICPICSEPITSRVSGHSVNLNLGTLQDTDVRQPVVSIP